jgi:DNA-binding NarL/FixJ family response regulator
MGFVLMDGLVGVDSAVIRIILADSQVVYRVGILQLLTSGTDMRVVAQTNTLEGIRRAVERFFIPSPTQSTSTNAIILLANNLVSGTVDAIPDLVRRAPQSKIIAQLDEKDEANVVELYRRGVSGIIPRSISPDLLVKCVRKVAAGETWIDNQSVNRLTEAFRFQTFTGDSLRTQPRLSSKELAITQRLRSTKSMLPPAKGGSHSKHMRFEGALTALHWEAAFCSELPRGPLAARLTEPILRGSI